MSGLHQGDKIVYFRNFIFGVEDSLASTVGLLSGVAVAGMARGEIVRTGFILIFVEAFSMAVGSYLSEQSTEDYAHKSRMPTDRAILGAVIMFCSYIGVGLIPIFPYATLPIKDAFGVAIALSLITLFVMGIVSAKISKTNVFRSVVRMTLIGGLAVIIGAIIGKLTMF